MNNLDMTLLTEEQVFGDKKLDIKLDIIKKYGTRCAITDFAILLGGHASSNKFTREGNTLKDRAGVWWTKTPTEGGGMCIGARIVDTYGNSDWNVVTERWQGARPILPYSSIKPFVTKETTNQFRIKEIEFGEYPQTIVDEEFSRELEEKYNNVTDLRRTGKTYTTDSALYYDYDKSFIPRKHEEYEYNGSKYIRFVGDENCNKETLLSETLSDGREVKSGEIYWVRVEPVKWLVDEKENIALSKKIIFSGVQFKHTKDYQGDFDNTDIKQFMDNYFSKEIMPQTMVYQQISAQNVKALKSIATQLKDIAKTLDSPSRDGLHEFLTSLEDHSLSLKVSACMLDDIVKETGKLGKR